MSHTRLGLGTLSRNVARHTLKPGLYRAVDFAFPTGRLRHINGDVVRLSMQASRFYPSTYEPDKAAFLRRYCRPGSTVIDVGAHVGVFTVLMARSVGAAGFVTAFEPAPATARLLELTIANNDCGSIVDIRREAVAQSIGEQLFYSSRNAGDLGNTLFGHTRKTNVSARRVHTTTIDAVTSGRGRPVSCIKIDAEGAELDILHGAMATLRKFSPALAIEVHPFVLRSAHRDSEELWDLLGGLGYRVRCGGQPLDRRTFVSATDGLEIEAVCSSGRPYDRRQRLSTPERQDSAS